MRWYKDYPTAKVQEQKRVEKVLKAIQPKPAHVPALGRMLRFFK